MKIVSRFFRKRRAVSREAAKGRQYFFLGEGIGLTRLKCGHYIYVDPLEESVCACLIAHGEWEANVRDVVLKLVQPGDDVLEVGGHVGYYTLGMARRVGATGTVTTFEANPRLAALARRSVRLNGYGARVDIRQQAVADKAGPVRFVVSRQFAGGGHLYVWDNAFGGDTEVIDAEGVCIDDLDLPDIKFIRIDAEGSEPLILRGAERILRRPDILMCIEWDVLQMRYRADPEIFVDWLVELGFQFWRIEKNSRLVSVPAGDLTNLPPCDLIVARSLPAH